MDEILKILGQFIQDDRFLPGLNAEGRNAFSTTLGKGMDFMDQNRAAMALDRLNVNTQRDIDPFRVSPFRGYMAFPLGGAIPSVGIPGQGSFPVNYLAPGRNVLPDSPFQFRENDGGTSSVSVKEAAGITGFAGGGSAGMIPTVPGALDTINNTPSNVPGTSLGKLPLFPLSLQQNTPFALPKTQPFETPVFGQSIPEYPEGGYTVDMFDGLYNLGTKRGRRKQKQLGRLIKRANRGNENAANRLAGMMDQARMNNLKSQGWDVDLDSKRNQTYTVTNPETGEVINLDLDQRRGFWDRAGQVAKASVDPWLTVLGMPDVVNNTFLDRTGFGRGLSTGLGALGKVAKTALNFVPGGQPFAMGLSALQAAVNPMAQKGSNKYPTGLPGMGGFSIPGIGGQLPAFGQYNPGGSLFDMLTAGGGFGAGLPQGTQSSPQTPSPFSWMFPRGQVSMGGNSGFGSGLGMFGYQDGGPAKGPLSWIVDRNLMPARPLASPEGKEFFDQFPDQWAVNRGLAPVPMELPKVEPNKIPGKMTDDYILKHQLAQAETGHSENPYAEINPDTNALGKYQFVPSWHKQGIIDTLGEEYDPTTKKGRENFLNDPEAQEKYFDRYYQDVLKPEMEKVRRLYGSKLDEYDDNEVMSMLHFNWRNGVKALASGDTGKSPTEGTGTANATYDTYMKRIRLQQGGPAKFSLGGLVGQYSLVPIQTEKGEKLIHLDGTITDVNATKLHKHMDDDFITDIVPEGTYVASNDKSIRMSRKEAEDVLIGYQSVDYKEAKKGKVPEPVYMDMIFGKQMKLTPAEMTEKVKKKFPTIDKEEITGYNDIFTLETNQANTMARVPYINEIVKFNEEKRNENNEIPSFKDGGSVDKYDAGAWVQAGVQALPFITQILGGNKRDGYSGQPGQIDPMSQAYMLGSFPMYTMGLNQNINAQTDAYQGLQQDYASLGDMLARGAWNSARGQIGSNLFGTLAQTAATLAQQTDMPRADFSGQIAGIDNLRQRGNTRAAVEALTTPRANLSEIARELGPNAGPAIAQILADQQRVANQARIQMNQSADQFDMNKLNMRNDYLTRQQLYNNQADAQSMQLRNQQTQNLSNLMANSAQRFGDINTGLQGQLGNIASGTLSAMAPLRIREAMLAGQGLMGSANQAFNLGTTMAQIRNQNRTFAQPQQQQPMQIDAISRLVRDLSSANPQQVNDYMWDNRPPLEEVMDTPPHPGTISRAAVGTVLPFSTYGDFNTPPVTDPFSGPGTPFTGTNMTSPFTWTP